MNCNGGGVRRAGADVVVIGVVGRGHMPEADVRLVQIDWHIQPPYPPNLARQFFQCLEALARTAGNVGPIEFRAPATIGVGPENEVAGKLEGDFAGKNRVRFITV